MMNRLHTGRYVKYFLKNIPSENSSILDIGCGGGKFLHFLNSLNNGYKLYGLDHSEKMIALAGKVNQREIEKGLVEIKQGSVMELPFANNSLDMVTAFETVQFWPDSLKSFIEVKRVVKPGGKFIIFNYYPKEGTKWWNFAKIKDDKQYKKLLEESGFSSTHCNLQNEKGWIIIESVK
jgi:ubiquinone/menaquinone biosynthesis C-methylase UbiE